MTQVNSPLSTEDQKYIDEAVIKMEARAKKFFEHHGLTNEDVALGQQVYEKFLKDDSLRTGERSFFNSPLGRKAFIVGWFIGVNTP